MGRAGLGAVAVGDHIYLVGGHSDHSPIRSLVSFQPADDDTSSGKWCELPPMQARRSYLAVAVSDKLIYAIGGGADNRMLNTMEVFDVEKNAWVVWFSMPPMQSKRMQHAAIAAEGKVFVAGGFDGTRDMATFECFNSALNEWAWLDSMFVRRSYLAMTLAKGHLFAIGGQDRLSGAARAHSTVEAFDLFSERWYERPPLQVPRIAPAAATLVSESGEEVVYVCGGSDGEEVLASVECYTASSDGGCWSSAPPMHTPRLSHAVAVFRNKLYVLGGSDGHGPLDTFECFDPQEGRWSPPMRMGSLPGPVKSPDGFDSD